VEIQVNTLTEIRNKLRLSKPSWFC